MANWIYEFENLVHHRGRQVAVVHGGRLKTFDELNREAAAFANWVARRGFRRVAMYLPNVYEFYVAQFGALKAGAAGVPVNFMFARETIGYVLADSQAEALVVRAEDAPLAAAAARGTGVREVVSIGPSPDATASLEEIVATHPQSFESVPRDDDDLFNLMYTSGTTGRPKGVCKTHRNMGVHIMNMIHVWKLGPSSVWLCAGPLYHTSGLESSSLPVMMAGGTVVLIKWDVELFFDHVQRYRPVGAYIAGSMLADIAHYEHPERWDTSSLRFVVGGGAPQNERDIELVRQRYGFVFTERLGMTEAGIIFVYPVGTPGTFSPREELPYHIRGSCGKPLYNQINFRLIDPATGRASETGEGELQLRGDSLFKGYWNLPELTRRAFTEDGWFRTGDIVRIREDGHVFHVRRRDEIIISGGENVSPRAIEAVVQSHPEVVEAAVFALPDQHWGQAVCVAVVKLPGSELDEAGLIRFCKESGRLARFEVPKRVFFRDSLPKTPTQSVPRSRLAEEYMSEANP
jgi:fatty-acyl-CoA synthase